MNNAEQHQGPIIPNVTHRDWRRADVAGLEGPLTGRRATLVNRDGSHPDYRVLEGLRADRGAVVVYVVPEVAWWEYVLSRIVPDRPMRWPAQAVWVEDE